MRIDGKAISPSNTKALNAALDAAWGNPHHIVTESPEVFLELTDGPDSVEVLVGGDILHIHDRRSATPAYLAEPLTDGDGRVIGHRYTDLACGEAYRAATALSPLERIPESDDQHLIIVALMTAAALSEDHGHHAQAEEFRRLWQNLYKVSNTNHI